MNEQQTNQTTDTTNADAPQQEVASTLPGESSALADTSAAPGATEASSDARASVQSSAPAESIQQSSVSQEVGTATQGKSQAALAAGDAGQSQPNAFLHLSADNALMASEACC